MKSPRERMSEDEVWASIEQKWHKRNLERKASGIGKRKKKKPGEHCGPISEKDRRGGRGRDVR